VKPAFARPRLVRAIAALLAASSLQAAAANAPLEQRIARVEQGLLQAVAVAGQPQQRYTLADEMARLHVPGVSVAVIHGGAIEWARGYGVARAGGAPVTPGTLFQAGSISKPLTAMAALKLVESGKLSLDQDVNTWLRSWKLPKDAENTDVTLRELLSHTAGVTVHGFRGYAAGEALPTLVQVLNGMPPANSTAVKVDMRPGSGFRYSGGGYTVVQLLLNERSGKSFPALMHDTVLGPLGMTDSTFAQPLPPELRARAAAPHDGAGQPVPGGAYTYPEMAAAGLWSTPTDLAKYVLEVQRSAAGQSNRVLSQSMTRLMLTPVKDGYGLGLESEGDGQLQIFSHGGANVGFQNSLIAYTERGDAAVVMTNGEGGSRLANDLMRAIAAEYAWPTYKSVQRSAVPIDDKMAGAVAGRYLIPGLGDFTISRDAEGLLVELRKGQTERLYAASSTVFFVLSRELELRFSPVPAADGTAGRLVTGGVDAAFSRTK
jgi:CubicO group peptidase (beta-lactamase class C family)